MALIMVSNRVSVEGSGEVAQGGLAVALSEALRSVGGTWMGWSGEISDEQGNDINMVERNGISYALINLTEQDYGEYYTGFANRTLWPLMHYRVGLTEFSQGDFVGYKRVNAAFARHLQKIVKPDDLIWVHDYHLMPLAHELRLLGLKNRMGYFHHIPWPSPDVFGILPAARELLRAMMDYDVVGLQTEPDRSHFCQCLLREMEAAQTGPRQFGFDDRSMQVLALPIGIDVNAFASAAQASHDNPMVSETLDSISDRSLILGVDRLDYSKGVAQRMEAYAQFLQDNPHRRMTVEYLQITPFSRADIPEYEQINQSVAETAGRINGADGEPNWTPIRYLNKAYNREVLAGLYRAAGVCLVTPMRDGMNLVAKEFVAAQNPDNPGVLVLSRFAGASHQLSGAVIVNPYDRTGVARAIETALSMPLEYRQARWEKMMATISLHDIDWWVSSFYQVLADGTSELQA
ncbi:MAG: alpha,alpha-trehalose-phosphate synthase (UDP-forming) [Beijerinckiaceae bacterium]